MARDQNSKLVKVLQLKIIFIAKIVACATKTGQSSDLIDLCFLFQNFRGDICMRMSQYGHGKGTTQGGCSELSNISSKYLYPINSNITDEQGMGSYSLELFWHINI